MEINVLGKLQIRGNGTDVTPTAAKPRKLIALLAVRAGEVVPVTTLIEELWGTVPPPSAHATLQTYVLRVRRRLARGLPSGAEQCKSVLVTRHGGYLLDPDSARIDVAVYQRLVATANDALQSADFPKAAGDLRAALSLWRGPALADVPCGCELTIEANRLDEDRLSALASRIDAELRMGKHHELLAELGVLTGRHPMHERLSSQYMIALYRAGRRSAALSVYEELNGVLVDRLGTEPSGRLRNLYDRIVRSDEVLGDGSERFDQAKAG